MNAFFETGLSFILFLPTFAIVGAIYCAWPRAPRGAMRWLADLGVLVLAAAASIVAMRWGFDASTGSGGHLWPQIVATLLAYGVFLAVLALAWPLRARWLRRRRRIGVP
jgi:hypothetical protein